MKKLLALLFSIFLLSPLSVFADDISDFEIEGISIGDSLLDYMTEDEILKEIGRTKDYYLHLNEPNKYAHIELETESKIYDILLFLIKNNSNNQYITDSREKFKILALRGSINYIEDFDSCLKKRDEITGVTSKMFPNAIKTEKVFNSSIDSSGESIVDGIYLKFESRDDIELSCDNFKESIRIERGMGEGLNVSIRTNEIITWLRN
jgi:hypothetical protein